MWRKVSYQLVRTTAISLVLVVATFSIPVLLPQFAGHRLWWLIFTLVLAAVSTVVAVFLSWMERRFVARSRPKRANVTKALATLMFCCLSLAVLSHYDALFSDTLFFVLALPYLAAAWLIFHQCRTLFAVLGQKWHWNHRTRVGAALLIFVLALSLQSFVGPHQAMLPELICLLAAFGCWSVRFPDSEKQSPLN
jgi:hypothetical protein